jgi:hypothetical protein
MPLGVEIIVLEDSRLGWAAKVVARPAQALDLQLQLNDVADKLRSEYDLLT